MTMNDKNALGKILKQRRIMIPLTLMKLGADAGVSASHLARIEGGGRYPSAHVLRKLAKPLGFDEDELFVLAGYLHSRSSSNVGSTSRRVDPYVASVLSEEPVKVQRAVIGILSILKGMANGIATKSTVDR